MVAAVVDRRRSPTLVVTAVGSDAGEVVVATPLHRPPPSAVLPREIQLCLGSRVSRAVPCDVGEVSREERLTSAETTATTRLA